MSRRCIAVLVVCLVLPAATAARGHERRPVRSLFGLVLPLANGNPHAVTVGSRQAQHYPVQIPDPYTASGFSLGVPTFNWGYFGARHVPDSTTHADYYGDYFQRSIRQGY